MSQKSLCTFSSFHRHSLLPKLINLTKWNTAIIWQLPNIKMNARKASLLFVICFPIWPPKSTPICILCIANYYGKRIFFCICNFLKNNTLVFTFTNKFKVQCLLVQSKRAYPQYLHKCASSVILAQHLFFNETSIVSSPEDKTYNANLNYSLL